MSTRTSSARKPESGTSKSGKTKRASTKKVAAVGAKAAAGPTVSKTAGRATKAPGETLTGETLTGKAVPMTKTPDPVVVDEVKAVVAGATLRKKDLIESVTERAGVKRRDAKASLEAALEILGEAIAEGRPINLPGLGKLKVTRTKKLTNGQVFTMRIRQPNDTGGTGGGMAQDDSAEGAATPLKDPLAEAAE